MTWHSAPVKAAPKLWKQDVKTAERGFQGSVLFYYWKDKPRDSFFFCGQPRLWPIVKDSDKIINHQFSLFKNDLCKVILRGAITAKNTVME